MSAAEDAKLNRLVAAQLQKTKMCAMYQRGTCRDPKCRFAHSLDELRLAPDLTKTAICRMFTRGQCRNADCTFAHGEQELRVTPTVYKTQLCNFHMRGHCKKGNRCRHAHGEDELRSFTSQAQAPTASPPRTPTPSTPSCSEDTQSTATGGRRTPLGTSEDSDGTPYRIGGLVEEFGTPFDTPDLPQSQKEFLALMAAYSAGPAAPANPEWYSALLASGAPSLASRIAATPPPNPPYPRIGAKPTLEQFVPPFPAAQRGSPARPGNAEPMKVALSPQSASQRLPVPLPTNLANTFAAMSPNDAVEKFESMCRRPPSPEDLNLFAAAHAMQVQQASMDFELAAAQAKVKELQAKRHMFASATSAQLAATAGVAVNPGIVLPGTDSHFESIMQTLQKLPSRPSSPVDMEAFQVPQAHRATPPPGLETTKLKGPSGEGAASLSSSLLEGSRMAQPWHPSDISQKHGTAWVI